MFVRIEQSFYLSVKYVKDK